MVLPLGKFNGVILEPSPVYCDSFTTIGAIIFWQRYHDNKHCNKQTNTRGTKNNSSQAIVGAHND